MQWMVNILKAFFFVEMVQKFLTYFFVNDSIIFCWARLEDVGKFQEILGIYEQAFGQKNKFRQNYSFFLFFSNNTSNTTKELVKNLLGVPKIKEYERYLGLPTVVGRNKKASLNFIKDRV